MATNKLSPKLSALWARLADEPRLVGFVLIGGTALAMRIAHRVSEDLDFAYLGLSLPRTRISALMDSLQRTGFTVQASQNVADEQDFLDAGLALAEHQQNFVIDGEIKLSLVRFDNSTTRCLAGTAESPLRIASLDEIFRTKSLVCAQRSKTRDWFDLYILMTHHGFNASDMHRAFADSGCASMFDLAAQRLRQCKPTKTDEGYLHLIKPAPSLTKLRNFFSQALDQLEIDLSRAAFKAKIADQ